MPSATSVRPRTLLRDGVYERVREAIVDGTLAPGERLKDAELEAWLGVSRTPIREALQRLERDGLVTTRPNKSTLVAPHDPQAVTNARDVVSALHELATRLAVPRLTDCALTALEQANHAFGLAISANDSDAALAADDEFHSTIVRASGNELITELLHQSTPILRRDERIRFTSALAPESFSQHNLIIERARAGDADGAAVASRDNWIALGRTGRER